MTYAKIISTRRLSAESESESRISLPGSASAVSFPKITIPNSGEVEKPVRHLSIAEDNYATAWKTMQGRYKNRRVLSSVLIIGQPNLPASI